MSKDPYHKISREPFYERSIVKGRVVAVLDVMTRSRNLELIDTRSRVLKRHEVHEIILTDDLTASPGKTVSDAVYLAFFEVTDGGVIVSGDHLVVSEERIGELAGYDETHCPNHINLVIRTSEAKTGRQAGIHVGDSLAFLRR